MLDTYDGGYKQALLNMQDLINSVTKRDGNRCEGDVWGNSIKTKKALETFLKSFLHLLLTDREAYEQFKATGNVCYCDFVMKRQDATVYRYESIKGRAVKLAK